jgi:putative membrane protein
MSHRLIARAATCALLLAFAFATSAQDSPPASAQPPSQTDSDFMRHAAADGMAEVRMGQMALQKSSNGEVKKLARRIVTDHTRANTELKKLADAEHVSLPAGPDEETQQNAATIGALDAAAFDRAWTAAMVGDHQKAVELFTTEAGSGSDPATQAFAKKTLPTLKTHLELAQRLQESLGQSAGGDTE